MAEPARARVVRVTEMSRHGTGTPRPDIGDGRVNGPDHRVGLRRQREMDHRLGQREPRLRQAYQLQGLCRRHRHAQRARLSEPDVFAGQYDHSPGDEARILPRFQHPGQIVQCGVGVPAADGLDERACHVVVLVTGPVIADRGPVHGLFNGREINTRRRIRSGCPDHRVTGGL